MISKPDEPTITTTGTTSPSLPSSVSCGLPYGVFYHPFMASQPSLKSSPKSHTESPIDSSGDLNAQTPPPPSINIATATCAVTDETHPVRDMVRCVVSPDKIVVADLDEKLPGEFVYMRLNKDIIKKAIWRNSFTTAFREKVSTPKNFAETIQFGLLKKSLETLGLCKKAGILVTGFAKTEELLMKTPHALYCVAHDASDHGRKKLEKLAVNGAVIDAFSNIELSAALGMPNTMHLAIEPHALTFKLYDLVHKLTQLRDPSELSHGQHQPNDISDNDERI